MKIYGFSEIFFAQNEAQIVLSMMGERKRAFYCRINEFENPTKLNLCMDHTPRVVMSCESYNMSHKFSWPIICKPIWIRGGSKHGQTVILGVQIDSRS